MLSKCLCLAALCYWAQMKFAVSPCVHLREEVMVDKSMFRSVCLNCLHHNWSDILCSYSSSWWRTEQTDQTLTWQLPVLHGINTTRKIFTHGVTTNLACLCWVIMSVEWKDWLELSGEQVVIAFRLNYSSAQLLILVLKEFISKVIPDFFLLSSADWDNDLFGPSTSLRTTVSYMGLASHAWLCATTSSTIQQCRDRLIGTSWTVSLDKLKDFLARRFSF